MTALLPALADQSDIGLWPWPVWVFIGAVALLLVVFVTLMGLARAAATEPPAPPRLPERISEHCVQFGHYYRRAGDRWACQKPECTHSVPAYRRHTA